MKHDRAFFHQQLLRRQSIDFVKYENYTDVDILAELVDSGEINELNEIAWVSFKYYLVEKYEEMMGEDREEMRMVQCDKIETGSALKKFTDKLTSLQIRIKILAYFRDNTKVVFGTVTDGIEVFEHECVRLIHFYTQGVKDDTTLYEQLINIAQNGLYEPLKKAESELEALRKTNKDLEKANSQLKNDLDALKKQYDELKTLWDNRNKRKKPVQYGISSDFQNDESQWVIDQLIRHDYVYIGRLFHGEDVYVWKKSKSLFAFFVDRFTEQFNLRDTNEQIPWHLFEGVFVGSKGMDVSFYKGLKDLVSKYRKSGKIPQNDDVIERVLREAKTKPWLKDTTNPK